MFCDGQTDDGEMILYVAAALYHSDEFYDTILSFIFQLIKWYWTKNIIHHIQSVLIHSELWYCFSFMKYFIRIAKLYICFVLVNIGHIYLNYSHCGPIHLVKHYQLQVISDTGN